MLNETSPRPTVADPATVNHFRTADSRTFSYLNRDLGLSLDAAGFAYLQNHYASVLGRDPTAGELRVLDALSHVPAEGAVGDRYAVTEMITDSAAVAETWADLTDKHARIGLAHDGKVPPITWEDALHLTERYLYRIGRLGGKNKQKAADAVERAVIFSPHALPEAIAAGYRPRVRLLCANGDTLTVLIRQEAPPAERAPAPGDVILYCPAVPLGILEELAEERRTQSAPDVAALRAVVRKPLLLTALELSPGLELYPYRLPHAEHCLPVDALCRMPEGCADAPALLLRVDIQKAAALTERLRRRGLTTVVLGCVTAGESVLLRMPGNDPQHDSVAATLSPALIHAMGKLSARTYRPTLREDVRAEVVRPAVSRLPSAALAEDGTTPAGWETVALTASNARVLDLPDEHLRISAVTVRVTLPGSGYAAAMDAVAAAIEAIGGREAEPHLTVQVTVEGAVGDRVAEVICGLYRAAAEGGYPLLHPQLTVVDAKAEPAVTLTVAAYAASQPGIIPLTDDHQWSKRPQTVPAVDAATASTFLLPVLRRSMEGSLYALTRALGGRRAVESILCPVVIDRCPDGSGECLNPASAAAFARRLDGASTLVFAMSEHDAALLLTQESIRAAVETHIAAGGRCVVLGPACRAFAAHGFLPRGLTKTRVMPTVAPMHVAYTDTTDAGIADAIRVSRGVLLAPATDDLPHLLTLTPTDGEDIPPVHDGFVGRDGAVLGLLNGVDSTLEPLLHASKFPVSHADTTESIPENATKDTTEKENPAMTAFEPLSRTPRAVILDTDIGPDCDDVGAIVTLIHYAEQYGFPILGVCNCTSNRAGTGAIDAVFRHCGMATPPLGQWSQPGFMDDPDCHKYNDAVAEKFSPAYRDGTLKTEDEVTFYRRLLADAPDDGVTVITIGMFNNLAALLRSPADGISPLTGMELVRRKVHCLVSMAAILPEGRECNVVKDYRAAEYVLGAWPTAIYLSDFHVGFSVRTGYAHITDPAEVEANPLALSYHLYTREWPTPTGDNSSYDLTAVQFAVLGEGDLYGLGEPGRLEFYAEKSDAPDLPDATRFIPDPNGKCRFMVKRVPDSVIADSLNEILHRY